MEMLVVLAVVVVLYFLFRAKNNKEKKENITELYLYRAFETELIQEINKHRSSLNLNELVLADYISHKCLQHNKYMHTQGRTSHDNFQDRAEKIKYNLSCSMVGENLSYNFSTPKATLYAWLQSSGHKENLENPDWDVMGVSNYNKFSTNIFAQLKNK